MTEPTYTITAEERLIREMDEAERKAWDSLSRYKFQMFGYWAAIWVHLNRIAETKRPNPFRMLVHNAREATSPHRQQNDCELLDSPVTAILGPPPLPNECAYCGEACEGQYCSEEHEEHRSML